MTKREQPGVVRAWAIIRNGRISFNGDGRLFVFRDEESTLNDWPVQGYDDGIAEVQIVIPKRPRPAKKKAKKKGRK